MTRPESYAVAIAAEIRSQKLYKALQKSFSHADTAQVFKELVLLEENHETKLRAAFAKEFPSEKVELQVPEAVIAAGLDFKDPAKVLEYAISREEMAHDAYLKLAETADDLQIKSMMLKFASEEIDHKILLLTEMQKLQGALSWYDPSELTGLMEE